MSGDRRLRSQTGIVVERVVGVERWVQKRCRQTRLIGRRRRSCIFARPDISLGQPKMTGNGST